MAEPVNSYRDLKVWQAGIELVDTCYQLTQTFPATENFGLTSQIRRAAVSVPANIAEGKGRNQLGEYVHHLGIANGSLMELETHMIIATRLGYITPADLDRFTVQANEIGRMLNGLMTKLKHIQGEAQTRRSLREDHLPYEPDDNSDMEFDT